MEDDFFRSPVDNATNILGIRHFQPDELLFISTEEMEKKGKVDSTLYVYVLPRNQKN